MSPADLEALEAFANKCVDAKTADQEEEAELGEAAICGFEPALMMRSHAVLKHDVARRVD